MVIVVDPRRRIVEIHRPDAPVRELRERDTIDGAEVVPGWTLPVAHLFAIVAGADPAAPDSPDGGDGAAP
jgi:hypothetical protein